MEDQRAGDPCNFMIDGHLREREKRERGQLSQTTFSPTHLLLFQGGLLKVCCMAEVTDSRRSLLPERREYFTHAKISAHVDGPLFEGPSPDRIILFETIVTTVTKSAPTLFMRLIDHQCRRER